jgi:Ran GTPase-activating protein (RanGAP) involved in mRNA processing and transport
MDKLDYSWKGIDCFQALKIAKELSLACPYSYVDFSHNSRLSDEDVALLIKAIAQHDTVTELKFSASKLGPVAADALLDLLEKNKLKNLILVNNSFNSSSFEILSKGLRKSTSLQALDMSINNCQAQGLAALLEGLQNHPQLKTLHLDNCAISCPEESVFSALRLNTSIKHLSLYSNNINKNIVFLFAALEENRGIEILNIEKNNIDASCNKAVADSLKRNSFLKDVNFSQNLLGGRFFSFLAEAVTLNRNLINLNLSNCKLSDKNFEWLFCSLKEQLQFKQLTVKNNEITSEALRMASDVCKEELFCTELDLGHNKLGDRGLKYLVEILPRLPKLRSLSINHCEATMVGLEVLVNYLLFQKNEINELDLTGNKLGDKGATILRKLISENKKIERLLLDENEMTSKGVSILYNALKTNDTLVRISCSNTLGNKKDPMIIEIKAILSRNLEKSELKKIAQELDEIK